MKRLLMLVTVGMTLISAVDSAVAAPINLALNPAASGLPHPLNSDSGWGSGALPWEIVDGLRAYDHWAHGLAFTGGHTDVNNPNSGGWLAPAGVRQATIMFDGAQTFNKVVIWHHGDEHVPATASLDFFDGINWQPISSSRIFGAERLDGSNSGISVSDEYTFAPVTGSQIRYSFDNSGLNILGTSNVHGWIYEFEVFNAEVPEPASLALVSCGVLCLAAYRWRRGRARTSC